MNMNVIWSNSKKNYFSIFAFILVHTHKIKYIKGDSRMQHQMKLNMMAFTYVEKSYKFQCKFYLKKNEKYQIKAKLKCFFSISFDNIV